jgi:hypothetical protein
MDFAGERSFGLLKQARGTSVAATANCLNTLRATVSQENARTQVMLFQQVMEARDAFVVTCRYLMQYLCRIHVR